MIVSSAIAAEPQTIKMEGSTTVGPIADAYVEAFKRMYPAVTITVNKSGSGNGAAALVDSRCDIANMSRFMKDQEFKDAVAKGAMPVAHAIAMDGVCVVVHPSNPVGALTTAQVRDIYNGKISNWKELGGADQKIVAVSRDTSSGTYETFESLVMAKQKMAAGVQYVASSPEAHAMAKSTAGAVAYVGLGFIDKDVKALKIDGVMPSRKTIAKGEYPISRPLFMFTNGYPKLGSIVHAIVTFHLTPKGQDIIDAKGFVPVTEY
jgi:phosphate transport system substrate-binding protein